MSKIIDVLSRRLKQKSRMEDPIQEELANTFFPSSIKKYKSQNKVSKTPWVITGLVILLTLFLILSNKNVNISVQIAAQAPKYVSEDTIQLVTSGKSNTDVVQSMYFDGDAKKLSEKLPGNLALINFGKSGWANFTMEFKKPVNLKEFDIAYNARGDMGDEHLTLVLVDKNNSTYRMKRKSSLNLTNKWNDYEVSFQSASGIDLENIAKVKFEFGGLTVGNYSFAKIFLKDIRITKTRGVKWL